MILLAWHVFHLGLIFVFIGPKGVLKFINIKMNLHLLSNIGYQRYHAKEEEKYSTVPDIRSITAIPLP